MSSFRDNLLTVLAGGLPALIDDPAGGATTQPVSGTVGGPEGSAVDPRRPEEIAPVGTIRDREPFLLNTDLPRNILIGTAAIIGVLALVMIARR